MSRAITWLRFVMRLSSKAAASRLAGRTSGGATGGYSGEATAWSLREWDSAPPKIARGSVNVFSIRILSGGYVRWLPT